MNNEQGKNWYEYFRKKTIEETNLFENPKNIDYGKEYDRMYKLVKRKYGELNLNLKIEKLTYQFVTGKKQRITAYNLETFKRKYTAERMQRFASKYKEVREILDWYLSGEITLQELDDLIDDFKNRNMGYIKNYG